MQKPARHVHDLLFLRQTVAHHRLLYLHGGVLVDRHTQLLCRAENDAAPVCHGDAGGDILAEKKLLDGDLVRLELLDKLGEILLDLYQPGGQRQARRCIDRAVLQHPHGAALRLDQPEANDRYAGVDTQYAHDVPPPIKH